MVSLYIYFFVTYPQPTEVIHIVAILWITPCLPAKVVGWLVGWENW